MVKSIEMERALMSDILKTKVKRISVSPSRQITIPKEFFDYLNINNEIFCELKGKSLSLTPIRDDVDFSDLLLQDLIQEGYTGQELLQEFRLRKKQIRPGVEKMIEDAREDALKARANGHIDETEELFGDALDD